jgi:hypothetical protein
MKVYTVIKHYGKVEVRTKESLEREKQRLKIEYLASQDIFTDFLDSCYCATDFYKKEPDEEAIMANFDQYCENCAHTDTFGQYQEVEIDENDEN